MEKLRGNLLLLISEFYRNVLSILAVVFMAFMLLVDNSLLAFVFGLVDINFITRSNSRLIGLIFSIIFLVINILLSIKIRNSRVKHKGMLSNIILGILFIIIAGVVFLFIRRKWLLIIPIVFNLFLIIGSIIALGDINSRTYEEEVVEDDKDEIKEESDLLEKEKLDNTTSIIDNIDFVKIKDLNLSAFNETKKEE
ncbi:MAG: hypothetical protein Q4B52_06030 [Tissierellia bacterium]|nr:hypothetical protein [Tissierellia bacterium]